jgi:GH25 family lysozyme M1 (1,4-beta-N-acetylmuramidase)
MSRAAVVAVVAVSLAVVACQQPQPLDVGVAERGLSVCPGASTLEGVDVSTYDGTVDWAQVKASGRAFAITRVGDGLGGDDTFDANWAGIKAAGMVRGAYQYFRASDDPIKQADILLGKIGTPQNGDLPPTLDLEVTDGQTASVVVTKVKQWLAHVQAATGRTPMIYTSPGFWPSLGSPDLSTYVLWVAHWGTTCPTMPTGWSTWQFHQYSDTGTVAGIGSNVDLDVFDGDQAALDGIASNGTPPVVDGGATHDLGHAGDGGGGSADGGATGGGGDDLGDGSGSGGGGSGGGTGTGGNGDTGGDGKGDAPGAAMAHGCSMGAGHDAAPAPILVVLAILLVAQLKRRDQKWRRGARGPA